jgi:hypothetical protein
VTARCSDRRWRHWRITSSWRPAPSPGTAGFLLQGRRLRRAAEDTRQPGGDALVVDGRDARLWQPSTPDDRADAARIVAAARERRHMTG